MPARDAFKIPEAKPEYLVLLVSGLTASIGLDKVCRVHLFFTKHNKKFFCKSSFEM